MTGTRRAVAGLLGASGAFLFLWLVGKAANSHEDINIPPRNTEVPTYKGPLTYDPETYGWTSHRHGSRPTLSMPKDPKAATELARRHLRDLDD